MDFAQRYRLAQKQAVPKQDGQLSLHRHCDPGPKLLDT